MKKTLLLVCIILLSVLNLKAQCGPGEDIEAPVFGDSGGNGTLTSPFVNLLPGTVGSVPSGTYYFNFNGNTFQGVLDNDTDGGGWLMILNYVHLAGDNSALQVRNTDLPLLGSSTLGDNEAATANWGHFGNQLAADIDFEEMRFYGETTGHSRIIDFKTTYSNVLDYVKTGTGSFNGIENGNFSTLTGHTANIPASAVNEFADQNDFALTNFPFWRSGIAHWGIRGLGSRWEVDDQANNTRSTIHRVWVRGDLSPVTATTIFAQLDATGNVTVDPTDFGIIATDNCVNVILSLSQADFDCTDIGNHTIQLTATDDAFNAVSIDVTVIVQDNILPSISTNPPANPTFDLDAVNGTFTLTLADLQAAATDNCGVQSLTLSQTSFDCANIGANTVTVTATDVNGKINTTDVPIIIRDNTAPTVQCVAPFTVLLNTNGTASITVSDVSASISDNCSTTPSLDITDFDCTHIGDNIVTLSVTDAGGNISMCNTTVTVDIDATTCPSDIIVNNDAEICGAIVNYMGCNTLIQGLPSGSLFPIGTTNNIFEVLDNGGNTIQCSFSVTVNDTEAPQFATQDITLQLDNNGLASLTSSDLISETGVYIIDMSGTLDRVDISSTGTQVVLSDDEVSVALPIGFDFGFYGNSYTEFFISSNGFITFTDDGEDGCCDGQLLPDTSTPNNLIAFDWNDIDPDDGGTMRYETTGTVPNRILIMDWDSVTHIDDVNDITTTQVKLFETTNRIEIHTTNIPLTDDDKTQGLENIDGTKATIVPGRNAAQWNAVNEVVAFIAEDIVENCSVDTITVSQTDFTCSDIGVNTLTVTVTDVNANAMQMMVDVTVVATDLVAPVISLVGNNPQQILLNTPYVELGATTDDGSALVIDASTVNTGVIGSYSVTYNATDASCNDAVQVARMVDVVNVLSIGDNDLANSIKIHPNPTNSIWNIKTNNQNIEIIQVFDILGKQVISLTPSLSEVSIDAFGLNNGIYLAKITTENGSKTVKLIKE